MPRFSSKENPEATRWMALLDQDGERVCTAFEFDTDQGYYKGYIVRNKKVVRGVTGKFRTYITHAPYTVIDRRTGKVLYKVR
jgi:hypothetical protein